MPVNEDTHNRPVRMVFTTRAGGVSASPYDSFNLGDHVGDDPAAVAANRARLARVTGLDTIIYMEQLHTNTVTVVDENTASPVEATDAVVTSARRVGLAVLVADCVPVLLADAAAGVAAAVQAARMGAPKCIVRKTEENMV